MPLGPRLGSNDSAATNPAGTSTVSSSITVSGITVSGINAAVPPAASPQHAINGGKFRFKQYETKNGQPARTAPRRFAAFDLGDEREQYRPTIIDGPPCWIVNNF